MQHLNLLISYLLLSLLFHYEHLDVLLRLHQFLPYLRDLPVLLPLVPLHLLDQHPYLLALSLVLPVQLLDLARHLVDDRVLLGRDPLLAILLVPDLLDLQHHQVDQVLLLLQGLRFLRGVVLHVLEVTLQRVQFFLQLLDSKLAVICSLSLTLGFLVCLSYLIILP